MTRALAMISGGLDSILAAKLIKDQGIDVIGICFKSYFFSEESAKKMSKQINIPLEVIDFSNEHMNMVKKPKHGFGKNMNPCIDCHAMMMNYSGDMLKKFNADFIVTGEVLNQRPMSQNRQALNIVKKESGFSDKILRPLCAKNLKPTDMELNGLVDREKLLDISGRSRKVQIELADKWGVKEYPSPAGGCKLTEPNYAVRLKDLLFKNKNVTENEISLLRYGRHFRIDKNTKIISARTAEEAKEIKKYLDKNYIMFLVSKFSGSLVVLIGDGTEENIELGAKIAARYSKGKDEKEIEVKYGNIGSKFTKSKIVNSIGEKELLKYLISVK